MSVKDKPPSGSPVALVNTPLAGVPSAGVTSVGDVYVPFAIVPLFVIVVDGLMDPPPFRLTLLGKLLGIDGPRFMLEAVLQPAQKLVVPLVWLKNAKFPPLFDVPQYATMAALSQKSLPQNLLSLAKSV